MLSCCILTITCHVCLCVYAVCVYAVCVCVSVCLCVCVSVLCCAVLCQITKYAFSGGGSTLEEHRAKGGNCDIDVPYQYLTFFEHDDNKLEAIRKAYSSGEMTTSQIKNELVAVIQPVVTQHQRNRALVTDEMVKTFMTPRPLL
jgi:hypothetical protein